jgi:hypothetical protein
MTGKHCRTVYDYDGNIAAFGSYLIGTVLAVNVASADVAEDD